MNTAKLIIDSRDAELPAGRYVGHLEVQIDTTGIAPGKLFGRTTFVLNVGSDGHGDDKSVLHLEAVPPGHHAGILNFDLRS